MCAESRQKVVVSEEKPGDFRFADYMSCDRIFMFAIRQICSVLDRLHRRDPVIVPRVLQPYFEMQAAELVFPRQETI
jgi:hypothetical protein